MDDTKTPQKPVYDRQKVAGAILARIAEGEFLTDICEEPGMPHRRTFWEWVDADPALATQCAHARARAAATDERAVAQLVRDVLAGKVEADAARIALNGHTWLAKVRNPKVYGDRLEIDAKVQAVPVLNMMLIGADVGPDVIDVTPEASDGAGGGKANAEG